MQNAVVLGHTSEISYPQQCGLLSYTVLCLSHRQQGWGIVALVATTGADLAMVILPRSGQNPCCF
jgi:hypothetical protein